MNVSEAADSCRILILSTGAMEWDYFNGNYDLSVGHILTMCDMIICGEVSDEKAHRWLGWIQACMCHGQVATLKELKQINKDA